MQSVQSFARRSMASLCGLMLLWAAGAAGVFLPLAAAQEVQVEREFSALSGSQPSYSVVIKLDRPAQFRVWKSNQPRSGVSAAQLLVDHQGLEEVSVIPSRVGATWEISLPVPGSYVVEEVPAQTSDSAVGATMVPELITIPADAADAADTAAGVVVTPKQDIVGVSIHADHQVGDSAVPVCFTARSAIPAGQLDTYGVDMWVANATEVEPQAPRIAFGWPGASEPLFSGSDYETAVQGAGQVSFNFQDTGLAKLRSIREHYANAEVITRVCARAGAAGSLLEGSAKVRFGAGAASADSHRIVVPIQAGAGQCVDCPDFGAGGGDFREGIPAYSRRVLAQTGVSVQGPAFVAVLLLCGGLWLMGANQRRQTSLVPAVRLGLGMDAPAVSGEECRA